MLRAGRKAERVAHVRDLDGSCSAAPRQGPSFRNSDPRVSMGVMDGRCLAGGERRLQVEPPGSGESAGSSGFGATSPSELGMTSDRNYAEPDR